MKSTLLKYQGGLVNHRSREGHLSINFDLTRDQQLDVVVGRADGLVEVVHFADGMPTVAWSQSLNEAIHSLRCGRVSSSSNDDVVCTFAGRVTSFSNEPMKASDVDAEASRAKRKLSC